MKIQPVDFNETEVARYEPIKPVAKSRLKRLLERFAAGGGAADEVQLTKGGSAEFDPSSVCLDSMVQNFIEESNEKQSAAAARYGRHGCNCFNGNFTDSSEDELDSNGDSVDSFLSSSTDACEILKSLVVCSSVSERNLLADSAKIAEKNKIGKLKNDHSRKIVADGLLALGYDASICKSIWEKSPTYPAGEYEYVDVITEGERLIIDIDFKSEFEIARSTKTYKKILQTLPHIFVGNSDRLQRIISVVTDAAKQSLKKKGMPFPPWRKAEYVNAKWLSSYTRTSLVSVNSNSLKAEERQGLIQSKRERSSSVAETDDHVVREWELPEIKPKTSLTGAKIVTGLSSLVAKP